MVDYRDNSYDTVASSFNSDMFDEVIRKDKIYGDLLTKIRNGYEDYVSFLSQNE